MAVTPSFRAFVLEQLADAKRVSVRSMFGGVGIYWEGIFFALIDNDTLFFKVNDATRPEYRARGSLAFDPFGNGQRMESYYEVPGEVLEDRSALATWRAEAVSAAVSAKRRPASAPTKGTRNAKAASVRKALPGKKPATKPRAKSTRATTRPAKRKR